MADSSLAAAGRRDDLVPFGQAVRAWFAISLQTFGGPAGQIAVMQRHLVEERRWIGQGRFLHALSYCMLLPGPEAQQLAIYVGWLLNGVRGGLVAGVLFVLPGMLALLAASLAYVALDGTLLLDAVFAGLAPAVVAIVAQAVWRVGRRALGGARPLGFAVAAFLALAVFAVPFPVVVALAAAAGWLLLRDLPPPTPVPDDAAPPVVADVTLRDVVPSVQRSGLVVLLGLALWLVPVVVVVAVTGVGSVYAQQGLFFSGAAVVTFGGAYAVLAFVAQRAVEHYGWLSAGDMVRGLALAESTPGPLIMVVQFVAFLGAYHDPGSLTPWVAGVLASLLTTWVTFVPCFLLVFLGAPYAERLRGNRSLSAALSGITAAVVGVIANLGLYFAAHTLFSEVGVVTHGVLQAQVPELGTVRPVAVALTVLAAVLVFARGWPLLRVLGASCLLGAGLTFAGVPGL